jgi:hypothetical protein
LFTDAEVIRGAQIASEYETRQAIINELVSSQGDVFLLERIKLYDFLSLYLTLSVNTCLYFVSDIKGAAIAAFNARKLQDLPLPGTISGHICFLCSCCVVMR